MARLIILTLNSGSSSLKFGLFDAADGEPRALYSGAVEEIGSPRAHFWVRGANREILWDQAHSVARMEDAVPLLAQTLRDAGLPAPDAIGHRVVHGGPRVRDHREITPALLEEFEAAVSLAPLHIPAALSIIRQAQRHFPNVREFACLDTAFHRTLPEIAARFALPQWCWEAGIRRYGFHGLSCESVLHVLKPAIPARLIIAHLGSGASITAVANGCSVDTTMGFTPTGGIVMGTRPGDLDPGVLLYLLRMEKPSVEKLEDLLEKQSGLLGLSGQSSDMRELHRAEGDASARRAIEIFCRSAKKALGAFVAILAGLDMLVFTGGIGEHDAFVRQQICSGLEPLGIVLDGESNERDLETISSSESKVRVRVFGSDEDGQIARHCARLFHDASRAV